MSSLTLPSLFMSVCECVCVCVCVCTKFFYNMRMLALQSLFAAFVFLCMCTLFYNITVLRACVRGVCLVHVCVHSHRGLFEAYPTKKKIIGLSFTVIMI